MTRLRVALLALDILLTAAIAGFFYAYSSSVMRGLDVAGPAAVEAMNAINAEVRNPVFAPAFFGPLVVGVAVVLAMAPVLRSAAAWLAIAGVLFYAAGGVALTALVHIPMNEALAAAPLPSGAAARAAAWQDYSERWTLWNHVRTLFSFASLVALVGALRLTR